VRVIEGANVSAASTDVNCVIYASQLLTPPDEVEKMVNANRPVTWRLACRTVVGKDNVQARLKLKLQPQKDA
jgi:hypothetical protein